MKKSGNTAVTAWYPRSAKKAEKQIRRESRPSQLYPLALLVRLRHSSFWDIGFVSSGLLFLSSLNFEQNQKKRANENLLKNVGFFAACASSSSSSLLLSIFSLALSRTKLITN